MLISCNSQNYELRSSDGSLKLSLEVVDGNLVALLSEDDAQIIASDIVLEINDKPMQSQLLGRQKRWTSESIDLLYGEFSKVDVSYSEMVCDMTLSAEDGVSYDATLTLRLFDGSFAYRIELKGLAESTTIRERGGWRPANLDGDCYSTNREHEPLGPLKISKAREMMRSPFINTPFIYDDGERLFSIHECDLFDYPQLIVRGAEHGGSIDITNGKATVSGDFALPWRVVIVGKEFEDLHNQKPIYQVLSREAEGDYSWVKPGVSMWDWRVKGTTFDGFTYDMNTATMKRFIDFCSSSSIEYLLIDAEWYNSSKPLVPVEGLDIREVVEYGKDRDVGIILYYDMYYVTRGKVDSIDFETVAKTYADFGVAGMKYGFLSHEDLQVKSRMAHNIISTLARYKLLVDFHDNPIPYSGMERTYPNYITREYCHAQLDRRTAFIPRSFVKMACINLLAGHMDQTNGTFALNEMKSRSKGPYNDYNSTVSAEVARFVVTHTGALSVILDAPEAYGQKADLFHVISSIPSTWDETRYIEMRYDSHISVAKRNGDSWYAAVVYNEKGGNHKLNLDFLDQGATYSATIYRDAPDTDYINNKESYTIESRTVTSSDSVEVAVPAGGGFTVIFEKQ